MKPGDRAKKLCRSLPEEAAMRAMTSGRLKPLSERIADEIRAAVAEAVEERDRYWSGIHSACDALREARRAERRRCRDEIATLVAGSHIAKNFRSVAVRAIEALPDEPTTEETSP